MAYTGDPAAVLLDAGVCSSSPTLNGSWELSHEPSAASVERC